MSRSNKNLLNNPSTRWFEWSGSEGKLQWYDKESKTNHLVELPFTFLVLDQLNTVTGYNDETKRGYFSNEVRKATDILNVRDKKGLIHSGIWKDDCSHLLGAKFTKSIYIAFYNDEKELVIGNIKFSGSSLGEMSEKAAKELSNEQLKNVGWFNFCNHNRDIEDIAVTVTGNLADKKGVNTFFRPVFKRQPVSEATEAKAIELDKKLQEYLKAYFAKQNDPDNSAHDNGIEDGASDAQIKLLYSLANEAGLLELDICDQFGADNFESMTKQVASKAIEYLQDASPSGQTAPIVQSTTANDDDIPF